MQMFRIGAAAVGVAAMVSMTASAQGGKTDTKATDVLAAARKAIGGKRLDDMKTFSVQASVQRNVGTFQMNADLELLLELPDKYYRSEVMSGPISGGSTTGFNGDKPLRRDAAPNAGGGGHVFVIGPGGLSGDKLTPEEQEKADHAAVAAQRVDLSRLMLGWFASAHPSMNATYTYAGEAESPDGKAHVIDVKTADGFACRLFVDEQTSLPLMLTYQAPQPRTITSGNAMRVFTRGSSAPSEEERKKMREDAQKQLEEVQKQPPVMADFTVFFEDWQDVDGIKFPMKIRRAMAGTTTEEWAVGRVKVNPKIDAKKFAVDGH